MTTFNSKAVLAAAGLLALLATAVFFAGAASAAPNLVVDDSDVWLGVRSPTQQNTVSLNATVHNTGDTNATNVAVTFYLDTTGTPLGTTVAASVPSGGWTTVSVSWNVGATSAASHTLIAVADPSGTVTESNEADNEGQVAFTVNQRPNAAATINGSTSATHASLIPFGFDGSGSTDPDGTIQSYVWIFDDGQTATGDAPQHTYTDGENGGGKQYTITLIVTDDDGGTDSAQVTAFVTNRAPFAAAQDVNGLTKTNLVFDGTGSYDLDGRIVNATWDYSDGVVKYGLVAVRSFDDDGVYSADLTITDEDGSSDLVSVTITITNQAPTPVISTSPAMPFTALATVLFDARNSYDVDGGIANYTWVFAGGLTRYGINATTSFPANGSYNVTLLVIDDDGDFAQLTMIAFVGDLGGTPSIPTPPIAAFTASALTVSTFDTVTFDASASTDDTGIVSYVWDFGDGATGLGVAEAHSWDTDGTYVVTLNVTDTDGNSTLASRVIRVLNRAPVASFVAGPNNSPSLTNLRFNASGSFDPDGQILYYQWNFGDGLQQFGMDVTRAYARPGTYNVTLTITDNDGGQARHSLFITVTNVNPVARAPANFSVPTYTDGLFDAGSSYDPDGVIVTYTWDFGDGNTGTGRSTRHVYATQGVRTVVLTVRDDFGAQSTASMQVTVTNTPAVVSVSGPATLFTAESGPFTAIAFDRDGSLSTWLWDWGDSPAATSTTPFTASHAYANPGIYTVTLTVTDNSGAPSTATYTFEVLNQLPRAVISAPTPPVSVLSKSTVTFGSAGSSDAEDPGALQFYWIFGDGAFGTGASPTHTYDRSGTYTAILTVADPDGGASSATILIEVRNQFPVAAASANLSAVDTLLPVTFDGRGSNDPDGTIGSWFWEFGDGQTSSEAQPSHTYMTANPAGGTYTVRLTVTDNLGLRANTTMQLTVNNRLPVANSTISEVIYATLPTVLRGNLSTDADGFIVNWTWEFVGDTANQFAYGPEVGHSFPSNGTQTVRLTVRDDRGGQSTVETQIFVASKPASDTGKPGNQPGTGNQAPGFDAAAGLAAVAVAALAAMGSARRRRNE